MFQQTLDIELLDVQAISIHQSLYYNIQFRVVGQTAVQQTRLNPEAFYPDPKAGDIVCVNVLMGNIMGAEKLDPAASE